ncbi:MAG: histidine phosphatase family protein [Treponema sp.]|nr:histidine phosphatase family protein [Treponema sp.]
MFLYIIRHGEPDYKTDTLTKLGMKQAKLLSLRFKLITFDKIFSSPLGRAKQTAMPTCVKQKKEFEVLPWLSEDLAYKAMSKEIDGKTDWWFSVQNTKIRISSEAKSYETMHSQLYYDSVTSDFDKFLAGLGYEKHYSGSYQIKEDKYDRVALFCHDGVSRILLSHALRIPFHIFCASFSVPHTGVTVLEYARNEDRLTAPRCLIFSDLSHLYQAKLKNVYNNVLNI